MDGTLLPGMPSALIFSQRMAGAYHPPPRLPSRPWRCAARRKTDLFQFILPYLTFLESLVCRRREASQH